MIEARQTEGEDPDPLINGIVRLWSTTGHQNNLLRITVCNALRAGCTKAKIARAVRTRVFGACKSLKVLIVFSLSLKHSQYFSLQGMVLVNQT